MSSLVCLALSNAVVATLLAVLAAVVARFCRRPAVRHALWLLVLLKLITPPLLPLSVSWPRSEDSEPLPESMPPIGAATIRERPVPPLSNGRGSDSVGAATVRERPVPPLPNGRGSDYSLALIMVWLGGALAWWTVAAVRLRKFRRLLRQARLAPADVQEQGRCLAELLGLRRCPPIVFVSAPLSPLLWALGFSPRLLVPTELWRKLTAEQQDTLLAHELAHLRRGDHWVRRLELLVLGLYWWHPIVWWARRRLQEAEEECCDALVVAVLPDAGPAYAAALVETVAFLSQTRPAALVGASGVGHVPLLKRRLTMILTETSSRKPSRIGFWIVLGLGTLLLPLAPQMARTEALEEPEGEEATERVADPVDAGLRWLANPHLAKALQMTDCVSCHQSPVSPHELQHPWKGIHDELLRLTEEYSRELRKSDRRSPSADARSRADEIEKLQDEIELLKALVQIKEAHMDGTRALLNEYRRRLENYQGINRSAKGAIPTDTLHETRIAVTKHEVELKIYEAELKEPLLRLKQAERRLARLQRPAEKPDGDGRAPQEKRLRELEQKVENLLKEIRKMREDTRPDKPRSPGREHNEARGFIWNVWPTLDLSRLESSVPKAQKAFMTCKEVGDSFSIRKLLEGTESHADRLAKEFAQLRPDLVIDDEKEALQLKKVSTQIVRLGQDIEDYLKKPPPLAR